MRKKKMYRVFGGRRYVHIGTYRNINIYMDKIREAKKKYKIVITADEGRKGRSIWARERKR